MSSPQTIVLITGANQGIGYSTALNLLRHSPTYHIIIGSRSTTKGTAAALALHNSPSVLGTVSTVQLDVTSTSSISSAVTCIQETHDRLDVLVNNAGIIPTSPTVHGKLTAAMATNVIGAASVTDAFTPLLLLSAAPRIVFVSSSMGSLTLASDVNSGKYHSAGAMEYRASKAALNMVMLLYWVRLEGQVKVGGADPGLCATEFTGNAEALRGRGAVEADVGGERVACVVRGERDQWLGRVVGEQGVVDW